jgi:hypothetical protein
MQIQELLKVMRHRPFKAFRITLTTQQTFDVSHPDLAFPHPRYFAVGARKPGAPPDAEVVMHWIDLNHIVHIHPLHS